MFALFTFLNWGPPLLRPLLRNWTLSCVNLRERRAQI